MFNHSPTHSHSTHFNKRVTINLSTEPFHTQEPQDLTLDNSYSHLPSQVPYSFVQSNTSDTLTYDRNRDKFVQQAQRAIQSLGSKRKVKELIEKEKQDRAIEDKLNRSIKREQAKLLSKQPGFLNVSKNSGSAVREKMGNVSKTTESSQPLQTSGVSKDSAEHRCKDKDKDKDKDKENRSKDSRPPLPKKIN